MSSAALHASCLSEFLRSGPDLDAPAQHFFDLQKIIVDAAWRTSTADDLIRLGLATTPTTAAEQHYAQVMQQVRTAAAKDVQIGTAFRAVGFVTAHPSTLVEPDLVSRAARINGV